VALEKYMYDIATYAVVSKLNDGFMGLTEKVHPSTIVETLSKIDSTLPEVTPLSKTSIVVSDAVLDNIFEKISGDEFSASIQNIKSILD
jgi:hypothetical protein